MCAQCVHIHSIIIVKHYNTITYNLQFQPSKLWVKGSNPFRFTRLKIRGLNQISPDFFVILYSRIVQYIRNIVHSNWYNSVIVCTKVCTKVCTIINI